MADFRIYYQNFRGLKTKTKEIRLALLTTDFDMIVGTETWLDDSICDSELFNSNYNVYRRDRNSTMLAGKAGGGVVIAVSTRFHSKRIQRFESPFEDLWVSVKLEESDVGETLFGAIYIPPPVTVTVLDGFFRKLQ